MLSLEAGAKIGVGWDDGKGARGGGGGGGEGGEGEVGDGGGGGEGGNKKTYLLELPV